jgi:hypothetical protein
MFKYLAYLAGVCSVQATSLWVAHPDDLKDKFGKGTGMI